MENKIVDFKKMEVAGVSKKEALALTPFNIRGEATLKYNAWRAKQTGEISAAMIKQFMVDYLTEKKALPGDGYYITIQSAVKDTRKRPYKYTNIKKVGTYKPIHVYRAIDEDTKEVIAEVKTNKADVINAMQKAYQEKDYTGNALLIKEYVEKDGNNVLGKFTYTPAIGTRNGQYLVFGIEA